MKRILLTSLILMLMVNGFVFSQGNDEKKDDPLEIVVIYHDMSLDYGQVIKAGAEAAGKDLGCDVVFEGPVGIDIDQHVAYLENAITMEADGIGVSNPNGEVLNPVIQKALDAGIPTITFDSEADGSPSLAFVGQNLYQSGYTQADTIAKLIGEKGKVLIITGEAAATWSIERETGNRDAFAKFPNIQVLTTVSTGWEEQAQYAAIENAILANPDVAAIATLDAGTTPTTGVVLSRLDRTDIVHVGHDLNLQTMDNIKNGWTDVSFSQYPYNKGYQTVKIMYDYLTNGTPLEDIDTGILQVDSSNIDEYLQKLADGEPIG